MSRKKTKLKVGNIEAHVVRKPIKNINLRIKAPAGNISISAPILTPDSVIRDFISKKLNWITKKQNGKVFSFVIQCIELEFIEMFRIKHNRL